MTKVDELRQKGFREYNNFREKANLNFEDILFEGNEVQNMLIDLTEAKSISSVNESRLFIAQVYCESIMSLCEDLLDSFLLNDTEKYNNELTELKNNSDSIFLNNNGEISEEEIEAANKLFDGIFSFYKKIQQNENNLRRKAKREFYGNIFPKWMLIFSGAWIAMWGLILGFIKPHPSNFLIFIMVGGWIFLGATVMLILRLIFYRRG